VPDEVDLGFFAVAFEPPVALRDFFVGGCFFFGLLVPKIAPNMEPRSDIDLASITERRSGAAAETGNHRMIQMVRRRNCSLQGIPDRLINAMAFEVAIRL
jgi:hypothetical protein